MTAAAPTLGTLSNVFGRIVTGAQVEQAISATLQKWMRTYLRELERQTGRPAGSLPLVRSYTTANDIVKWPEDQIPALIVVSDGISQEPTFDGEGIYTAVWDIRVTAICSAASREASNELAKLYTAATRALLVQKRSLGGYALDVDWVGSSYDDIAQERLRMAAASTASFLVTVPDVLNRYGGPPEPDDDPADLGQAQQVDIDALPTREWSGQPPDLMHLVKKEAP